MKNLSSYIKSKKFPKTLYHATIKQRLASIKKYGLGGKIPRKRFWDYEGTEYEKIKQGCFLDIEPENAYYYVESSDELYDMYEDFDTDDILLFSVDVKDLDVSKLSIDSNDQDNESNPHSYFYDGIIPFEKLHKESTEDY